MPESELKPSKQKVPAPATQRKPSGTSKAAGNSKPAPSGKRKKPTSDKDKAATIQKKPKGTPTEKPSEKKLTAFDQIKLRLKEFRQQYDQVMEFTLKSKTARITFYIILVATILAVAYMIAMMDSCISLRFGGIAPHEMIVYYTTTDASYPWSILWISVAIMIFFIYSVLYNRARSDTGRGFSIADTNVYGSAREMDDDDISRIADVGIVIHHFGTILGQLDLSEKRVIFAKYRAQANRNLMVVGSPGDGKSFTVVINSEFQTFRSGNSVIVTDTKGEIWKETVETARLHGYRVKRFDLKDPKFSDGWNILKELRGDDTRVMVMSKIIMDATGNEKDIHRAAEESLLQALLLYQDRVEQDASKKTLFHAYSHLAHMDDFTKEVEALNAMDKRYAFLKSAFGNYAGGSENLRGNICSGLATRLACLASPEVQEMTSANDIDLSMIGSEKTAVYLVTSDQHETMRFLANLFYSFAFLDLVEFADNQIDNIPGTPNYDKDQRETHAGQLPIPTLFLMEEFANLGPVPDIGKKLSTCRSRRIDITIVIQSISQLRDLYGEDGANIIVADCATWMILGVNDPVTAQFLEWRSGEVSVDVATEQHRVGESPVPLGRGYSAGTGRRSLFTAHELMTLPLRKAYLVFQHENCRIVDKFGMNRHPFSLSGEYIPISASVKVPLEDIDAKEEIRRLESERIKQYNNWVKNFPDEEWRAYNLCRPLTPEEMSTMHTPEVIPYPELEKLALEVSRKKKEELEQEDEKRREAESNAGPAPQKKSPKNQKATQNGETQTGSDQKAASTNSKPNKKKSAKAATAQKDTSSATTATAGDNSNSGGVPFRGKHSDIAARNEAMTASTASATQPRQETQTAHTQAQMPPKQTVDTQSGYSDDNCNADRYGESTDPGSFYYSGGDDSDPFGDGEYIGPEDMEPTAFGSSEEVRPQMQTTAQPNPAFARSFTLSPEEINQMRSGKSGNIGGNQSAAKPQKAEPAEQPDTASITQAVKNQLYKANAAVLPCMIANPIGISIPDDRYYAVPSLTERTQSSTITQTNWQPAIGMDLPITQQVPCEALPDRGGQQPENSAETTHQDPSENQKTESKQAKNHRPSLNDADISNDAAMAFLGGIFSSDEE